MARSAARSKRKISGGLYKNFRKKRLTDLARDSTLTKIANLKRKKLRMQGGHEKTMLLS